MRRLVLFDIDGTLVRGGPAKDAFHQAMLSVYGTAGPIQDHDFSGKTDPQIARELLHRAGFDDERIDAGLPDLWDGYLTGLAEGLTSRPMEILTGVAALLDALDREGDVALGLLTGNIARGARLKLGSVGLHDRFAVGGYGSDHEFPKRAARHRNPAGAKDLGGRLRARPGGRGRRHAPRRRVRQGWRAPERSRWPPGVIPTKLWRRREPTTHFMIWGIPRRCSKRSSPEAGPSRRVPSVTRAGIRSAAARPYAGP